MFMVDEMVSEEGQIEEPRPDLVRKEPLQVPGNLEFVEIDMHNEAEVLYHPQLANFLGRRSL
jgi:hypothetical protein